MIYIKNVSLQKKSIKFTNDGLFMTKCPCCGAIMNAESRSFPVSVGLGTSLYVYDVNVCPECSYEEDSEDNKFEFKDAVNAALMDCANKVLSSFKQNCKNFSDMERNFHLPVRTFSKWYNGSKKPSASAVALLRIINSFPWMEKAAEYDFESEKAQEVARHYYLTQFNTDEKYINYIETKNYRICTAIFKKNMDDYGYLKDSSSDYIAEKSSINYLPVKKGSF